MPKPATGKHAKTITTDTIVVLGFQVATWPPGREAIMVNYATGYINGEGEFVGVENLQKTIGGDDFNALAATKPNGTDTLFEVLQAALYAEIEKDA